MGCQAPWCITLLLCALHSGLHLFSSPSPLEDDEGDEADHDCCQNGAIDGYEFVIIEELLGVSTRGGGGRGGCGGGALCRTLWWGVVWWKLIVGGNRERQRRHWRVLWRSYEGEKCMKKESYNLPEHVKTKHPFNNSKLLYISWSKRRLNLIYFLATWKPRKWPQMEQHLHLFKVVFDVNIWLFCCWMYLLFHLHLIVICGYRGDS